MKILTVKLILVSLYNYELNRATPTCNAQSLDGWCFFIFMAVLLACDGVLFLPAMLRKRNQETLKQIVAEDAEFLEKRAELSASLRGLHQVEFAAAQGQDWWRLSTASSPACSSDGHRLPLGGNAQPPRCMFMVNTTASRTEC